MWSIRGDGEMKNKLYNPAHKPKRPSESKKESLLEECIRKGLIEKTEYGYHFKPEFFETLKIYEED